MSQPEMSVTGFSKCHTQSHLNESPIKSSPVTDSFTTCMQCSSNKTRSHNLSSDKTHREEMMGDKDMGYESSHEIGSFPTCTPPIRSHHFNSEEIHPEEMIEENEIDIEVTPVEKTNEDSVPKEDEKTESENIEEFETVEEKVSTKPIQNAHPMLSQEDSHLFNYFSKEDDKAAAESMVNWECERSFPWSRTGERVQNLSVPMFLYLLNNDIKTEMCDLDQKESEACQEHKWDEALRMRGMRSKLNLIREHQLLNAVGLRLDEETRLTGMESIADRLNVVDKREKLITDGDLYSEEAEELWKKWEAEDDLLEMNFAFIERAGLMQSLEEEWKILADEDKDRIALLYGKSKPEFPTDHRHKLTQNYP